jgi:hypothetical protein
MRHIRNTICSLFVIVVFANTSYATPLLETWDAGVGTWAISNVLGGAAYGSLSWAPTLAGRDGVLLITGGAATNQPVEDIVFTASGLAGNANYSLGQEIVFDFYAAQAPVAVNVYFLHDVGGQEYAWFLDVTPSVNVGGWASISAPISFDTGSGWFNVDDGRITANEFYQDIIDIDQIGISIRYATGQGGQIYGLDNFDVIPEPGTYAVLGAALLSLALCFRSRLTVALADIKLAAQR